MSTEIGRVLGQRYRIVAPIGMGASAQVFLADDARLRRRVAVKMLHEALADDADFLRRFRAEARAAAALSHPNVVAVYDWGDEEVAFIVTEFLAGGSLRALLDGGTLLSPGQALLVGLEAARALDYAHRRGFVHRDIKPANLLFGEEGRLRVADFGLARALAEAAWTEPQGAVLGTARYASPELATGEQLTGKADVYSLALVLIEAVTGRVPFTADTTLGTLMARVGRPLDVPEELGPLRRVLERAGVADPAERIDARTMAGGLLAAARGLGRPEPLPLAGALPRDGVAEHDDDPTLHAPLPPDATDATGATGATLAPGAGEATGVVDLRDDDLDLEPPDWVSSAEPVMAFLAPPVEPAVVPENAAELWPEPPSPAPPPPDERQGGHRRRWPWLAVVALLLIGGGTAGVLLVADRGPRYPVPDLSGRTVAAARAQVARFRWKVSTAHGRADGSTPGLIIRSDPQAGHRLKRGGGLTLVISDGNVLASIPHDLAGRSATSVQARLEELHLVPRVSRRFDERIAKGKVIGVAPGTPARVAHGRSVELLVSDGPKPRIVPAGLTGATEAVAKERLAAVQLREKPELQYNETVPGGQVISARPGQGSTADRDSVVLLAISRGPAPRVVPPAIVGATEASARSLLTALQLVVTSRSEVSDSVPAGRVISAAPGSGSTLARGATVALVVSKGPALVTVPSLRSVTSLSGAIAVLRNAGLRAGNVSGPAAGRPKYTSPPAGRRIARDSTVDIVLG